MVGDGVEAGYLAPFLSHHHTSAANIALIFAVYGVTVSISSWASGALSDIFGPKRVMWAGLVIWFVFEIAFLSLGVAHDNYPVMLVTYALRGFGYPLFAFGFLVWIAAATPARQLGSAVGWFWFAFAGGLPTLGSLFASFTIPMVGQMATFWASLGLVTLGGLITLLGTRERHGLQRLAPKGQHPMASLFSSISILWREPKIAVGGVVRAINTSSEYAFLVIMPSIFVKEIGFSLEEWLRLLSVVFISNIFTNLGAGMMANKIGYRRIIGLFGCVGSAISIPLFYYGPHWFHGNLPMAMLFGIFYGFTLGSFTPISGLLPQITPREKGAALSILGLGAGASTWLGPIIVILFENSLGIAGVIWVFSGLYIVAGLLTVLLSVSPAARAFSESPEGRSARGVALAH